MARTFPNMTVINAASRLVAAEDREQVLQLLDPVSDSLNHALTKATASKAKIPAASNKQVMALVQSIKDALTELKVLQEELE